MALRRGSTGSAVKNWQSWLNSQGFSAGAVDGIFGSQTEAAVKRFQSAAGITADGVIGPVTEAARARWKKAPAPTAPAPGVPQPTLRRGSTGAAVKNWQSWLNSQGFSAGAVDGIFGSQTEAAVKRFQSAAGITADGVIGPVTIAARNAWKKAPGVTIGVDFRKMFHEALVLARRGVRYVYGAEVSPSVPPETVGPMDCSEMVQYLFARAGFTIPDGSISQYHASSPIGARKVEIGDLAFQGSRSRSRVRTTHVVLALSENTAIEAVGGTARRVRTTNVDAIGRRSTFLGWRRPNGLPLEAAVVVTPVVPPPTDTSFVGLFRYVVDSLKSVIRNLENFGRGK